ncbi:2-C-methyl-D-erythritol 4-phosphate cytidylyltransferase [Arcticibacter pallidicorallinus]|uniref:2-C-methyl-D-erythritol 4-phosphate cytidylyltransferase n=2 Tax=Arcticibacter pallidicorallinus TaxID=1259464 RepID=A0A2T0U5D0_9SPHI|nr:2-C-methyl-D-erythritol 4-phosphate cytidylyltransferase [Arcticibacter pallidicorallinus]
MNADLPKQFHLLQGKPVLMHSIEAFAGSAMSPEIIIVLNADFHSYWKELCVQHNFFIPHQLIAGGTERFHSVKNALDCISPGESLIAVHDAVRPVITDELITRCYNEAEVKGSVIPVTESRDSLRIIRGSGTEALSRADILIVQTPQVFRGDVLKEAYQQTFSSVFTDDASVVEKAGFRISTTAGAPSNIKITYPEDLAIATLYLGMKA